MVRDNDTCETIIMIRQPECIMNLIWHRVRVRQSYGETITMLGQSECIINLVSHRVRVRQS